MGGGQKQLKVEINWVPMAFPYAPESKKPRRMGKLARLPRRQGRTHSEPLVKLSVALPERTNSTPDAYEHVTKAQKIEQSTSRE